MYVQQKPALSPYRRGRSPSDRKRRGRGSNPQTLAGGTLARCWPTNWPTSPSAGPFPGRSSHQHFLPPPDFPPDFLPPFMVHSFLLGFVGLAHSLAPGVQKRGPSPVLHHEARSAETKGASEELRTARNQRMDSR